MGYGNDKKLTENLPVVIGNKIIEARYRLPLGEQKLVLTLASKIKDSDTDFRDFEISAKEFSDLLGLQYTNYRDIKKAGSKLLDRKIEIETETRYIGFHWFSRVEYVKEQGLLKLRLHEDLKPFFLYILGNKEYTKFYLKTVLHFNSAYTVRIYELLKQYQKLTERTIRLSELREMLGIKETEYKKYNHFKSRIIEQVYREINEKSDIRIEFEEIKEGRKITAIKFYIKSLNKNAIKDDITSLDILPKEQITKLLQLEIQKRYVVVMDVDLIAKYSQRVVLKLLKDLKSGNFDKTSIHSPIGFFRWQLEELSSMFNET